MRWRHAGLAATIKALPAERVSCVYGQHMRRACVQGGSLLCCDGCPASYHLRCIGEHAKSLPPGDWLCPECALGGRGAPRKPDPELQILTLTWDK